MSRNTTYEFWPRQNESFALSAEHLAIIKTTFGVLGDILPVELAPGYAVSDDGRVFSGVCCTWHKDCPRELRLTKTKYDYRMARMHVNRKGILAGVHVLMARAFLPPPGDRQDKVRHLDGNPANNVLGNLAWGTHKENMEDMVRHGRSLKGMKNPSSKLNDRRVQLIRGLIEEGFRAAAIGVFFGVDEDTVRLVGTGEQWGHVP